MKLYFLILFLTLSLFGFIFYRSTHPTTTYQKLTQINSFYTPQTNSPCKFHIIGGIPNVPLPDGNIRINFNCGDGSQSNNYLRLGAITNKNLKDVLTTISQVNNFTLTNPSKINVNGVPTTEDIKININDTIDVYYN